MGLPLQTAEQPPATSAWLTENSSVHCLIALSIGGLASCSSSSSRRSGPKARGFQTEQQNGWLRWVARIKTRNVSYPRTHPSKRTRPTCHYHSERVETHGGWFCDLDGRWVRERGFVLQLCDIANSCCRALCKRKRMQRMALVVRVYHHPVQCGSWLCSRGPANQSNTWRRPWERPSYPVVQVV